MSAGAFFLKFQKVSEAPDELYFTVSGRGDVASIDTGPSDGWISKEEYDNSTKRSLSDADNWLPVNGHKLEIWIDQFIGVDGSLMAPDPAYAYLANGAGVRMDGNGFITVTTDGSGRASFNLKTGPLIHKSRDIKLRVRDTTQVKPQ